MVINDLKVICTRCQGSGRLAGITNMGISQINLSGVCPGCEGKGFQLTELGADLVDLLRPFVEEMIAEALPEPAPPPGREKQEQQDEEE